MQVNTTVIKKNLLDTCPSVESYSIEDCDTMPALFEKLVGRRGEKIAMREKKLGIWQEISWRKYGQHAKLVGLGLRALGVQRGDVVSILSENGPEWLFSDIGVQGIGAITNGVYPTDSAKQIKYILSDSRTKVIFVEDEEQLDKVLSVREAAPA